MHVIGVEHAGTEKSRIDVEVRPTPRPVILVLTAYRSVNWHVALADGARIQKVILGGYFEQEIQGLPAGIPVENHSCFPVDGSRRKDGWFWADEWNRPQWRAMVRRLNAMTGLPVSTFQGQSSGVSFIVDGKEGHGFGQGGLALLAPQQQPAPRDLLAASANAELHVVGVYHQDLQSRGRPLEVEVRPTAKPVVLVLTSYSSVVWNIKCVPGARLSAVIVGGYYVQAVDGLPPGVQAHYFCPDDSSFFGAKADQPKRQTFYAFKPNTLEYRRTVETLNGLTGLLVSTFQGEYTGRSFVIDGTHGRDLAQKERKPRPTFPKEATPEELLKAASDADVHVVGMYSAGPGENGAPVVVEVRPTNRPIVLALSSYGSVFWNLKIAEGAQVKAVILGGYYEQEIEGIPAGTLFAHRAYFPTRNRDYFWGFDWNSEECRSTMETLARLTRRPISTFQGEQTTTSFVIDGNRGRDLVRNGTRSLRPYTMRSRSQTRWPTSLTSRRRSCRPRATPRSVTF